MSWFQSRRDKEGPQGPSSPSALDVVRGYHQRTKHNFYRYAPGPPELDWENQPDPFRHWEGATLLPLSLSDSLERPHWTVALEGRVEPAQLHAESLSRFLRDSLALSAWKEAGSARWSLRVNPSSGNLHPTEAHLLLPALDGLVGTPCVAHYAPKEHALELRCELGPDEWGQLSGAQEAGCFFVGLTSIHWREAWKYGERAYRYCQHDVGHALASLSLAAAGLGWEATMVDELSSDELSGWLGCSRTSWPEAEVPETLLRIDTSPRSTPARVPGPAPALEWIGAPSRLSDDHVEWEAIEVVATASTKPRTDPRPAPSDTLTTRQRSRSVDVPLSELVRSRRSAVAMDGRTSLTRTGFLDILQGCLSGPMSPALRSLPFEPRLHLALFVHRVEGVEPGLYWLSRASDALDSARSALRPEFTWEQVEPDFPLYQLHLGNVRGLAARLSCQQEIAGEGAFSLGMVADFEAALAEYGAWRYPRLFWEAGAIGQCLYLEAEAKGLRGTGIGCFYDDPVHATLGIRDGSWQSLYHFTIGGPLEDDRLRTLDPYAHLER